MLLSRLEARLHALGTQRVEDLYYLPGPTALRLLSLGHREAAADLVWARSLVYFGEQIALRGRLEYLTDHVDAVIGLDPAFRDAYVWASVVTVYNSRYITRRSIETSNRYLELALEQFPRDGNLMELLAFNYAIEMPVHARDPGEKDTFRRKAAQLYARASRMPGSARTAGFMAVEMYTKAGMQKLAEQHLRQLYVFSNDAQVRRRAEARLMDLVGEEEAEDALAEGRALFEGWRREYPYIPPDLYVLTGPRFGLADRDGAEEPQADAGPDAAPGDP